MSRRTPISLAKARNDALLLRKIADDIEVADEIVGFHAQQTVEKALKAVLEVRGVDYPYTHDLARLFALLDGSGGAPRDRDDAVALTPWAAEFRYPLIKARMAAGGAYGAGPLAAIGTRSPVTRRVLADTVPNRERDSRTRARVSRPVRRQYAPL